MFRIPWPWDMIAALISAAVLILYVAVEFVRPRLRRRKLRRPCNVTIVIPPERQSQPCEFAILDDDWHHTKEITVPPHATIHLEFCLKPRLDFTESEFAFGCDGDANLDTKPIALSSFSSFIDKGKQKNGNPESDDNHYTDRHRYYHIIRTRQRSVGQDYIAGFLVATRDVGVCKADIEVTTEEVQGIHHLTIRVEKPQKTAMRCTAHKGCYIKPRAKVENGS